MPTIKPDVERDVDLNLNFRHGRLTFRTAVSVRRVHRVIAPVNPGPPAATYPRLAPSGVGLTQKAYSRPRVRWKRNRTSRPASGARSAAPVQVTRARVLSARTGTHARSSIRRDDAALAIEHLDAQLAVRRIEVDEQMAAAEPDRPRGQRARRRRRLQALDAAAGGRMIHRRETVAAQRGQAGAADAGIARSRARRGGR